MGAPGHPMIIGDLNLHDDHTEKRVTTFLHDVASFGLHHHVSGPTHRNGHRLDLLLSHDNTSLSAFIDILDNGFHDHLATPEKPQLHRKTITYRKTAPICTKAIMEALRSSTICQPAQYDSVPLEEVILLYNSELKHALDHFLLKSWQISNTGGRKTAYGGRQDSRPTGHSSSKRRTESTSSSKRGSDPSTRRPY